MIAYCCGDYSRLTDLELRGLGNTLKKPKGHAVEIAVSRTPDRLEDPTDKDE